MFDQMKVPPEAFKDEILEGSRINATHFNITYESGETETVVLVDDGMLKYWWYPPLAGYPLRADFNMDNEERVIQTVEEWR